MNCSMPELKRAFEAAGFADVKTLLSSGNVAFSAKPEIVPILEEKAEAAMQKHLGKVFLTVVRPSSFLRSLVESAPHDGFKLPTGAKPVVTFLRKPQDVVIELPLEHGPAWILKFDRTEVYSAYIPDDKASAFMALLERKFGKDITTRTLETVRKCSLA